MIILNFRRPARSAPPRAGALLAEGAVLVDVRERAEIEQVAFDVPGIVPMPLSEFEQRFAELPRERELVIACQSGSRSLKATSLLMYQGCTGVAKMSGGIIEWASKGCSIKGRSGIGGATTESTCCGAAPAPSGSCC